MHHFKGYKEIVTGEGEGLSKSNVFDIQQKCMHLRNAYLIALKKMGVVVPNQPNTTWEKCCGEAIDMLRSIGVKVVCARTVMNWNIEFRTQGKFPHPDPYFANGIRPKPKPVLFEYFPETTMEVADFFTKNQGHFTLNLLIQHFIEVMLPDLEKKAEEFGEDSEEMKLVKRYKENNPKVSTVHRWVQYLGFYVDKAKKSYYVDGHEYPEQQKDRIKMCTEYTKRERLKARWIILTVKEYDELQSGLPDDNKIIHEGYRFRDETIGEEMIEFHVDSHEALFDLAHERYPEFGGTMSVRAPEGSKQIICFGQDEAIFSENCSMPYQWCDADGKRKMPQKTQGETSMVSAFQSREFGFGFLPISDSDLKAINHLRKGQHYTVESGARDAALRVNGTTEKQPLKASPFIIVFPFGGGTYWTGDHTILQVTDILDCLNYLKPGFHYYFLFDHSSGHAKKRVDGLDARNMNVECGGSLGMKMRPTEIKNAEEYLGPFHDPDDPFMVKVGQTLGHVYPKEGEEVEGVWTPPRPFNLSEAEAEERANDTEEEIPVDKRRERAKYKKELISDLMETSYGQQEGRNNMEKLTVKVLQEKARAFEIPVTVTPTTRIKPGWRGRGIGLLAAAYARGWVDKKKLKSYQAEKTDNDNNLVKEFSLRYLLSQCPDFRDELTQLEYACQANGATAVITPKYHAELAGEGIEYSWGFIKLIYRRHPQEKKKGRANFNALLAKCLSRDVITTHLVRKFSRRARAYMVTYIALDLNSNDETRDTPIPHSRIEKLMKVMKSHRAAIDFDKGFVAKFVTRDDFDIADLDKKPPAKPVKRRKKN